MKSIPFFIVLLFFVGITTNSQTFHSDVQIDAVKTWTYSHGVNRETMTFTIDLIKLKFSMTSSSFLNQQNMNLIPLDARVANDENGQKFLKSKYEISVGTGPYSAFLNIEDYKSAKDELIVGRYNKGFAIEIIKDGKQTSFLACYIKELNLPIKYDPTTIWCQYHSFISNYRVVGVDTLKAETTEVSIDIDTVNHYLSLNFQKGYKFTFLKEGKMKFLESLWKFKKYRIEESKGEFLIISETETPVKIGNFLYDKFFTIMTTDKSTNKTTSRMDLYVSTSTDKGQSDEYIEHE